MTTIGDEVRIDHYNGVQFWPPKLDHICEKKTDQRLASVKGERLIRWSRHRMAKGSAPGDGRLTRSQKE